MSTNKGSTAAKSPQAEKAPSPAPEKPEAESNTAQGTALPAVAKPGTMSVTSAEGFGAAMERMAGAGLENVKAKDILIPRLTILQALSPQLDRTKPDMFISEAKRGDICDVGRKELFEGKITFIPVYFMTQYLEWKPQRKGLAGIHNDPEILQQCREVKDEQTGARKLVLPNGNIIVETAQFFGLNVTANYRLSFIPMSSTQLKKARLWNTIASEQKLKRADGSEYTPPMFYRSYKLGSVPESNDNGNWDGWTIEPDLPIDQMDGAQQKIFDLAMGLYNSITSGQARGDVESMQGDLGENGRGGNADNNGTM